MAQPNRSPRRLPNGVLGRQALQRALKEYRSCPTYWYIPKARALSDANVEVCANTLAVISDKFEGSKWDQETQTALLAALTEEEIIEPRVTSGPAQDRNALTRIIKTLLETLGLIWVFDDHELVITDVGESLRTATTAPQRRELIQAQVAKFQYPNPVVNARLQRGFSGIVPLLFLLDVLRRVGNTLTVVEYQLFVNLATNHNDANRIAEYVEAWRGNDQEMQQKVLAVFQNVAMPSMSGTQESIFGDDTGQKTSSRWDRIRKDVSYQLAFYCYSSFLRRNEDTGAIESVSPSTTEQFLEDQLGDLQVTRFRSKDDWFAYMGDPERRPSWFSHLEYEIANAPTVEVAAEVVEQHAEKLTKEQSVRVRRLQLEKAIELSYVNQPDLLHLLEVGLELQDNQVETPIGRIDLLCRGADGSYVVVEIKVGTAEDAVFGQILRYLGWIHRHYEEGRGNVRGIILAGEFPDKARYSRIGLLRADTEDFLKFRRHGFTTEEV